MKSPVSPIIYGDGSGGFELYWFHPGKHVQSIGNNTIIPERGVIPFASDHQYSIFTEIDLTPPYYISSTNTYILNSDPLSELPGDQFTPLRLAVKEKVEDNYYDDLWYEYVSLPENADINGAFIERSTALGVDDIFEIYLALEWLPGYPTSPIIGVNSQPPYLNQKICAMDDSNFNFVSAVPCAMVGMEILDWRATFEGLVEKQNNMMMTYELLFSNGSTNIYTDGITLAATGDDSLFASFNLQQSGYLTIRAADMTNEVFSDVFRIDIHKLPPLGINPQNLVFYEQDPICAKNIIIENTGQANLEFDINFDKTLFVLDKDHIDLEAGYSVEIDIEVKADVFAANKICSPIIINSGGDYYPQIIHVTLLEKGVTVSDENRPNLPEKFNVSQPFPNPFNSSVRFNLSLDHLIPIHMDVYNLIGQKLFSEIIPSNQSSQAEWDGTDNHGQYAASGIYFVRFSAYNETIIRKIVLLK